MTDIEINEFPFNILLTGHFHQSQVKVNWNSQRRNLPQSLIEKIDAHWHREISQTSKNSFIFNGDLCKLDSWKISDNNLTLDLRYTNYKELLYSNHIHEQNTEESNFPFTSKALGISAVLLSSDNMIIVIKRSSHVGEGPGKLDIVGGHIHPYEHSVEGIPDPFFAMKAEMVEEVNLAPAPAEELVCIGIIITTTTQKPELVFSMQSHRANSESIIHKASLKNSTEISEFLAIPNRKKSLQAFLNKEAKKLSPSAFGSLWLYKESLNCN